MIPVYICEDEPQQLKMLKRIVSETIKVENLNGLKLVCATKDPTEILEKVSNDELAIYFLDIELGKNKMSGLELAAKIRNENAAACIVMITAYNFALDTYRMRINVKDYIMKGDPNAMADRIKEHLEDLHKSIRLPEINNVECLKIGNHKIDLQDIYYISVAPNNKRKVAIHKKTSYITFTATLKELIHQNNASLFLVGRQYIININYVSKIDRDNKCIVMENGEKVQASRRRIKLLERKLSLLY